jgi:hypothetical protein
MHAAVSAAVSVLHDNQLPPPLTAVLETVTLSYRSITPHGANDDSAQTTEIKDVEKQLFMNAWPLTLLDLLRLLAVVLCLCLKVCPI